MMVVSLHRKAAHHQSVLAVAAFQALKDDAQLRLFHSEAELFQIIEQDVDRGLYGSVPEALKFYQEAFSGE